METPGSESRAARVAPWVNLALPGAGLILIGSAASGLASGLIFAACANFAVAAVLLLPDAFSRGLQLLGIALAGGSYLAAQLQLLHAARRRARRADQARRAACLRQVQQCLARGDITGASKAVAPLSERTADDLLVAYRVAQVRTAAQDVQGAQEAWQQVRRLDRHGIYEQLARDAEREFGGSAPAAHTDAGADRSR